jgi:hypothetical protein
MLKKTILLLAVILGSLAFTGCSIKANYYTKVKKASQNKPIVFIKADQDSTSLGLINVGNVTRTNYLYAFGTAAQTTLDNGYKYFTIIEPKELIEQYRDRKVHNLQEAYDACDSGKNSFKVMTSLLPAFINNNHCDHIIFERKQITLTGAGVTHRAIGFTIEMHNDQRPDSYATFDAQKVLQSDLLKDLDKKYFKENVR